MSPEDGVILIKSDRHEEFEDFKAWARSVEGTFDTMGMTTDEYMLWLRGPRDDLDRG